MRLFDEIKQHALAGYPAFYIHSDEGQRVKALVEQLADALNFQIIEYHFAYGLLAQGIIEQNEYQLETALCKLLDEDLEQKIIFIQQADLALAQNPLAAARLQYLIEHILRHYKRECLIVLQGEKICIPANLERLLSLFTLPLPSKDFIEKTIKSHAPDLDEERLSQISTALSGLSALNIEQLLNLIAQKHTFTEDATLSIIQQQKQQIIEKSGVLEMIGVAQSLEDIGGLENLKKWLNAQSQIFKHFETAKQFGVTAPKGVLIAGMPGCGKSLTAKAAAQLFTQPLLRLDMGRLMGKYVGESEHNMRKALMMAESIAPCVLWIDELEKGFVGMSGNNASEVSSRLLGYFLTWMQEKTAPVFILATANDITALPPELLRKGRFDEIFYVGFPNFSERQKIINIHLKKAKQNASDFDHQEIADLCRDYSGADIENAIQEAVKKAFVDAIAQQKSPKLNQEMLLESIKNTIPLRKTLKEKVAQYEQKFDELYLTPASISDGSSVTEMIKRSDSTNYLERLEVAKHPEVSEDILEKLSKDSKFEVQKAAFANRNCPSRLLDKQLSLLLDNTHHFDKAQEKELLTIVATHHNLSMNLLKSYIDKIENILNLEDIAKLSYPKGATEYKNIQLLLAYHPKFTWKIANLRNLFIETQRYLIKYGNLFARQILALNPTIAASIQEQLTRDEDFDVRQALAGNPNLAPNVQEILAKNGDWSVRKALAKNPNLTTNAQEILAEDGDWRVRQALVENPNLTPSAQEILAENGDWRVRETLAKNLNLTPNTQEILAEDEVWLVRETLAENPNLTPSAQEILAKDDEMARLLAARNPAITASTQEQLAKDNDSDVRRTLAENPNIEPNIQKQLAEDEDWRVRPALAANPNIESNIQEKLAKDQNSDVRRTLAENLNIEPNIQEKLAEDEGWGVRQALVKNPNIKSSIQEKLAKDKDSDVRPALAANPNIELRIQEQLTRDEDSDVRKALAANPNIEPSIQEQLAKDQNSNVRQALAANPHLVPNVLEQLVKDENSDVLFALAKNIATNYKI